MDLSPISFKTGIFQRQNNKSNTNSCLRLAPQMAKDTVQFTGAVKCLTNIYDKAFVEILEKDLNLTKEATTKLKNLVWNFLREHKIQSLGEVGGEEFFEEQVELQGRIMKKLDLPEDVSEFVAREVIHRCDEGERYIPGGLRAFEKDKELEEALLNLDGRKYLMGVLEGNADNDFYEYARKALRLSPKENYEFRVTIEDYLKENNLKSINDLAGEDMLMEQAELTELLTRKFELSDAEMNALQWELISRANSGLDYKPMANIFVKDEAPLRAIVENGGYNYSLNDMFNKKFNHKLFWVMSEEAQEAGYKNIFEIFKKENNPNSSKTVEFIKNSNLTQEQKMDLIIDLGKIASEPEEFAMKVPKHVAFDNFYGSLYNDMITERIIRKFDLPALIEDDLKKIVAKLQPAHVTGGEDCNIHQIAFEIADKYKLPAKAEKELSSIISEVLEGGTKSADIYLMGRLMNY